MKKVIDGNTESFANVKKAIEMFGVNVGVLGNKKGIEYSKKNPDVSEVVKSKNGYNEKRADRIAEIIKLAPCFMDGASISLKKGELRDYLKDVLKLNLDTALLNEGLAEAGVEVKGRSKKADVVAPVSETAPSDGFRTLNKEESYFFDALLTMMRDEDIETAQNLVATRIENEMKDEIKKVTEARLSGLNALRKQHKAIQGAPESE